MGIDMDVVDVGMDGETNEELSKRLENAKTINEQAGVQFKSQEERYA